MDLVGALAALSIAFVLILLLPFAKAIHKYWWKPTRIQRMMAVQGIQGPPYMFIYGSTKELLTMKTEVREKPLERLSHDIFPKVQPHIHAWTKQYGRNYLDWYGPQQRLIVTDPELVKELFIDKEVSYPKLGDKGLVSLLLGNGLGTVTDREKWVKQRRLANHAFHGESLKGMVPTMVDAVKMMLEGWEKEQRKEIDVFGEFKLLTAEVISRTAFGSSYVEGRDIFQMMDKLVAALSRTAFTIKIPGIGDIWKSKDEIEAKRQAEGIKASIISIIEQREAKQMAGDVDGLSNDFLGQLVKAYHEADESKKITVDELIDECKTFYFAGQETTSSSLAWTVFLLAINQIWQDEARKEVIHVFGDDDPNYDGIPKLRTMTMIVNESLRLYPPVSGVSRTTNAETSLGSLRLPSNTQIYVSNLLLHHDPEIWGADVNVFKPERFSEGIMKATNNNLAVYFPFGLGPRNCVGMNFAMSEIKIVLAMILRRYSFTLSPAYIHCPFQQLTTQPLHGIQVIFQSLK